MTDNTTLDAAIEAGQNATWPELGFPSVGASIDQIDRTYARALIASLLEGLEPPMTDDDDRHHYWIEVGYIAALDVIRRRAGLEVES